MIPLKRVAMCFPLTGVTTYRVDYVEKEVPSRFIPAEGQDDGIAAKACHEIF
jgi:hypothetical protein